MLSASLNKTFLSHSSGFISVENIVIKGTAEATKQGGGGADPSSEYKVMLLLKTFKTEFLSLLIKLFMKIIDDKWKTS